MLIYDCEIVRAIPDKDGAMMDGIEYCEGWSDFEHMGISVIGAYDYLTERYRVFCKDNFAEFSELVESHLILVGFNSIGFDNPLLAANGIRIPEEKVYDILVEIWAGAGLSRTFKYPSHLGFGLDAVCHANFGMEKSGNGALAPVLWQGWEIGKVIDYCLNDVKITRRLMDQIDQFGWIRDPRETSKRIVMIRPEVP